MYPDQSSGRARRTSGTRYKPEGLDSLCRATRFTRKELQLMYRGFKQESPSGMIDESTFTDVYQQYFPCGNSSRYAGYVFNTFDVDKNGCISFEEFVSGLSVLSRGSVQEKLQWAFRLYDINRDGRITRDEMYNIVSAIYEMVGKYASPLSYEGVIRHHVDSVFQKMDLNKDGVITFDEFILTCEKDPKILQSFARFDTQWC